MISEGGALKQLIFVVLISILKDILDKFCSCFGQLISTPKSKLFFSSNLKRQEKDRISSILSVSTIIQIGTWGTPFFTSRRQASLYQFIIYKKEEEEEEEEDWRMAN